MAYGGSEEMYRAMPQMTGPARGNMDYVRLMEKMSDRTNEERRRLSEEQANATREQYQLLADMPSTVMNNYQTGKDWARKDREDEKNEKRFAAEEAQNERTAAFDKIKMEEAQRANAKGQRQDQFMTTAGADGQTPEQRLLAYDAAAPTRAEEDRGLQRRQVESGIKGNEASIANAAAQTSMLRDQYADSKRDKAIERASQVIKAAKASGEDPLTIKSQLRAKGMSDEDIMIADTLANKKDLDAEYAQMMLRQGDPDFQTAQKLQQEFGQQARYLQDMQSAYKTYVDNSSALHDPKRAQDAAEKFAQSLDALGKTAQAQAIRDSWYARGSLESRATIMKQAIAETIGEVQADFNVARRSAGKYANGQDLGAVDAQLQQVQHYQQSGGRNQVPLLRGMPGPMAPAPEWAGGAQQGGFNPMPVGSVNIPQPAAAPMQGPSLRHRARNMGGAR